MRKNSLQINKGLSLSQAQSISNLCHQRAVEIDNNLSSINNFSKKVTINGTEHVILEAVKMPENIVELLKEKAKLHACQAFLMENIKAKSEMLDEIKYNRPDVSNILVPKKPNYDLIDVPKRKLMVDEEWGWEQLSLSELNEMYEAESFAAHIGQFIHKNGKLNELRRELPNIPSIEWMEIEKDKKSPVTITKHNDSYNLLKTHEELAGLHREYEQKVNYFKSKVKNLVTKENANIAKFNNDINILYNKEKAKLDIEYRSNFENAQNKISEIESAYEIERQKRINEIVSMRIFVDSRFKDIIDKYLIEIKSDVDE